MKRLSVISLILILASILHFKNLYGSSVTINEEYKANLEKEIIEHTKKLELNPKDAETHYNLGIVYYQLLHSDAQGYMQKAVSEFRKAIELKPDYQDAYRYLGMVYMLGDMEDEAIAVWEEGLGIGANSFNELIKHVKQSHERVEQCKKAIAANPKDAEAYFVLGDTYYKAGIGYGVNNKLNSAIKALRTAVAINPDFAEAHARLGYAYGYLGKRVKEMARELRRAIEIKPDFPPFRDIYMLLGDIDLFEGRVDMAMNEYDKGTNMGAYLNLGAGEDTCIGGRPALSAWAKKEEARWKRAIEEKSSDYEAHFGLAKAYLMQGNFEDAIAQIKETIRINPDYVDAYLLLGKIYMSEQPSLAIESYNKALKLKPGDTHIYRQLGRVYFHMMLSNSQNDKTKYINEAKAAFEKAIGINPDDDDAHYYLGVMYKENGELDKAIEEFNKVVIINPYSASAHEALGMIYSKMNQLGLAKQHMEEAERLKDDYLSVFANSITDKYSKEEK